MNRRTALLLALFLVALAALVLSLAAPSWIESVLGAAPDGGDGVAEDLIAVFFGALLLVVGLGLAAAYRAVPVPLDASRKESRP